MEDTNNCACIQCAISAFDRNCFQFYCSDMYESLYLQYLTNFYSIEYDDEVEDVMSNVPYYIADNGQAYYMGTSGTLYRNLSLHEKGELVKSILNVMLNTTETAIENNILIKVVSKEILRSTQKNEEDNKEPVYLIVSPDTSNNTVEMGSKLDIYPSTIVFTTYLPQEDIITMWKPETRQTTVIIEDCSGIERVTTINETVYRTKTDLKTETQVIYKTKLNPVTVTNWNITRTTITRTNTTFGEFAIIETELEFTTRTVYKVDSWTTTETEVDEFTKTIKVCKVTVTPTGTKTKTKVATVFETDHYTKTKTKTAISTEISTDTKVILETKTATKTISTTDTDTDYVVTKTFTTKTKVKRKKYYVFSSRTITKTAVVTDVSIVTGVVLSVYNAAIAKVLSIFDGPSLNVATQSQSPSPSPSLKYLVKKTEIPNEDEMLPYSTPMNAVEDNPSINASVVESSKLEEAKDGGNSTENGYSNLQFSSSGSQLSSRIVLYSVLAASIGTLGILGLSYQAKLLEASENSQELCEENISQLSENSEITIDDYVSFSSQEEQFKNMTNVQLLDENALKFLSID